MLSRPRGWLCPAQHPSRKSAQRQRRWRGWRGGGVQGGGGRRRRADTNPHGPLCAVQADVHLHCVDVPRVRDRLSDRGPLPHVPSLVIRMALPLLDDTLRHCDTVGDQSPSPSPPPSALTLIPSPTLTLTRWGTLLETPASVMGAFVVAVGAQIPDTVQAIAVARHGHGAMAVASAVGSQVHMHGVHMHGVRVHGVHMHGVHIRMWCTCMRCTCMRCTCTRCTHLGGHIHEVHVPWGAHARRACAWV